MLYGIVLELCFITFLRFGIMNKIECFASINNVYRQFHIKKT